MAAAEIKKDFSFLMFPSTTIVAGRLTADPKYEGHDGFRRARVTLDISDGSRTIQYHAVGVLAEHAIVCLRKNMPVVATAKLLVKDDGNIETQLIDIGVSLKTNRATVQPALNQAERRQLATKLAESPGEQWAYPN